MTTRNIFEDVTTLTEWVSYASSTSDGENSHLENKAVDIDLHTTQPSGIGDFKLRIAKEMSAFANTDSGIIALGIDTNLEVRNQTTNLEDWLDKNMRDMLEPQLAGIDFKTCTNANGDEFVLLYVPKGNVIPYRVSGVKSCEREKKNLREYFQRIGTNSVPIPMPIVRSLYLSNNRAVDIAATVRVTDIYPGDSREEAYVDFSIEIKPDENRLINEYYLEATATLLDGNLQPLHEQPIDLVPFGLNSPSRPIIPPASKRRIIDTFRVQEEEKQTASSGMYAVSSIGNDRIEHVRNGTFSQTGGIYLDTKFACDGLPLQEDRRLLILDSTITNKDLTTKGHEMNGWIRDCLVISWFSITQESGLYEKIVGFMNAHGFTVD